VEPNIRFLYIVGMNITSLEVAVCFYSVADSMAAVRMSQVGKTLIPLLLSPKILCDRPSKKKLYVFVKVILLEHLNNVAVGNLFSHSFHLIS
jgi:hypothetical protein